jgi:mono/diheme cytochrome c family protein
MPPSFGEAGAAPLAGCRPARGSEHLPARQRVIASAMPGGQPGSVSKQMFVEDLFGQFKSYCGGCHVDQGQGKFQVSRANFSNDMDRQKVLSSMKTDDPAKVMPPAAANGKPFSARIPPDPVLDLVAKLERWFDQNKPTDIFLLPGDGAGPGASVVGEEVSYLVSEQLGGQLSNIGSCVPSRTLYGSAGADMNLLDAVFEQATELPESLSDTDLTTLDSEVLARSGVIGFAPAYPLWSDGSAKMRAVRVPRGTSIRFDKATQRFEIPTNTRFYKTFLKKVVDNNGTERYRKIETRLIVTRPDRREPDGTFTATALFGSYAWNDEETEARLVQDPLHDGRPFKDRIITYVTDQPAYQRIVDRMPRDLKRVLDEENPGLLRRYAIPGSDRCIECHMGSPSADFVLGFTPLQLRRRPTGQGGTYEPTASDELSQLQRLIDYGVITGMRSPSEVKPLEESQGSRKARNEHELKAQAYLLGNCSHCHNPRGFPSVKQPALAEALDFLPSDQGGIFQFPLDRFSPVRARGPSQDVPIPYITPSLHDLEPDAALSPNYKPKWVPCKEKDDPFCDPAKQAWRTAEEFMARHIEAPWRSLIFRNVDTPFIYAEDFVIFPHMPRATAGHDCRASQILGDWMVSIPARPKNYRLFDQDKEPQPFEEVRADDPLYDQALEWARERLTSYRSGLRYNFCPDTRDIVDHDVLKATGGGRCEPPPLVPKDANIYDRTNHEKLVMFEDGIPDKPHWIDTDLTDPPGPWYPRRLDWKDNLARPDDIPADDCGGGDPRLIPRMLSGVRIDRDFRQFAKAEFPLGLWAVKDKTCDFSRTKTVADFAPDTQPAWSWLRQGALDPQTPVYSTSRGGAVFSLICVNCHGEKADSKGLLAGAISEMTGGDARVANFRDGLLGPADRPGINWGSEFDVPSSVADAATAEDWAGRYTVWMALGGTRRHLPKAILDIVGMTPVVGLRRAGFSPSGSPNMLQTARELCKAVLPVLGGYSDIPFEAYFNGGKIAWGGVPPQLTGLITQNGDADLWVGMCNKNNRPVVRVLDLYPPDASDGSPRPVISPRTSMYWADHGQCDPTKGACAPCYPDDAEVMNHRGETVRGVQPDNLLAVCLRRPNCPAGASCDDCTASSEPGYCQKANAVRARHRVPWCPAQLFAKDAQGQSLCQFRKVERELQKFDYVDIDQWATRGAINAGLAVFLYLQDLASGKTTALPPYNQCEKLPSTTASP